MNICHFNMTICKYYTTIMCLMPVYKWCRFSTAKTDIIFRLVLWSGDAGTPNSHASIRTLAPSRVKRKKKLKIPFCNLFTVSYSQARHTVHTYHIFVLYRLYCTWTALGPDTLPLRNYGSHPFIGHADTEYIHILCSTCVQETCGNLTSPQPPAMAISVRLYRVPAGTELFRLLSGSSVGGGQC